MATKMPKEEPIGRKRPPAKTVQERENQLIALASDLAEQQMRAGTAPAPVIVHYLKLGTVREQMERDKLLNEIDLLRNRVEAIQSNLNSEELAKEAIAVFTGYISSSPDVIEE